MQKSSIKEDRWSQIIFLNLSETLTVFHWRNNTVTSLNSNDLHEKRSKDTTILYMFAY